MNPINSSSASSFTMKKQNLNPKLDSPVFSRFKELYYEKFGIKPVIPHSICFKLIQSLLREHSLKTLVRIVELYFEKEPEGKVYHLPSILSSWSLNKCLPLIKYNPDQYTNAKELNQELY